MKYYKNIILAILHTTLIFGANSCNKIEELNQSPELEPLEHGFKLSASIGYCASLAKSAFTGEPLPDNVTFEQHSSAGYSSSGILHVRVTESTPLPFNDKPGDIFITGLWDGVNGGVISIIFADVDLFASQFKFYGIYTVPIAQKGSDKITTIFAEQDIIIGQGSDTLLNLSLSKPKFNTELARLNTPHPSDAFAAIKQNVWFIDIDQNDTPSLIYDDRYIVNGGGQIVEAKSSSGGILYHAMIDTEFSYSQCALNPFDGLALIQNLKASGSSIDLGNITMDFHTACDGRADVKVATGKYLGSNAKSVKLNWQ
jgi:hypothetical protein